MKRQFLLLNIILAFNILNAQEVYRFRTDAPQGLKTGTSTATALTLHYSVPEIAITTLDDGETKGQEITMKGSFGSFAEGLPDLPFENHYIAIPRGATVSVEVKEKGSQTLSGIDLLPAAALQGNAAVGKPKMQKDMSVFGKDANFPEQNVAIAQTTQIRGLDVVMLSVTPFRYNPVRKTLEVIYDMDIEVRFEGGNGQFGDARYRNPAWDGILRDLVINSDMLPEAHYYDLLNEAIKNREEGCEYLIISPDDEDILAYADTLRQFRNKQGILTKVVSTTECGGNDASIIKNYIKNAYDNWAIPPAAVMIFSGIDTIDVGSQYYWCSSGIPGFPLLFKGYDNGFELRDYHYSSDNPYADMNDDSIPDLALSRLPALNLEEYRTQVNKLIQYETNPPTRPDYYNEPIITSSYEENKWFLITSQSVNGFYRNKLGLHPKNFYMIYEYTSDEILPPETAWSSAYNTDAVVDYFGPNGQNYIAQQPDTLNSWRYMFDYSYLVDALNESAFLTLYRDHSSYDLWCSPWMENNVVKTLTNTDPTFLLSIGCDAALYSDVVFFEFSNDYWSMGEHPMIYEFCKAKVGALGGIGATTVTHSHFNDILTWGVIDNFWPSYMPNMGTMTQPDFTRPAYALIAGKLFLNQHAFLPNWWPTKITTTQNVFHYLGETYLNLYTEVPQQMAVDASPFSNSPTQYTMTAEEGATICLSHGGEIIAVVQATGQPQEIALPNLPIGERFVVTATKQNRFRYEQTAMVISDQLPFVFVRSADIKDQDGNGQLDYGEYANIDITLNNHSEIASESGEITLHCESPYVEIVQGTTHYPQMAANVTLHIANAFRIKLSNDVPDQANIQLMARFNENENTHEDNIAVTANAPVISITPEFWHKTADGEPSTHITTEDASSIVFSVKNTGHSSAELLQASLDIKAPFVEVMNMSHSEDIMPNEEKGFAFELNTTPNDITGAWLQAHLDIQYGEQHAYLDTIMQYGGIFEDFETDALNPYFRWTNTGNAWEYCTETPYEGQRCLVSMADTTNYSLLKARLKNHYVGHNCKISFYYQTDDNDVLQYYTMHQDQSKDFSNTEWKYGEVLYNGTDMQMNWRYQLSDTNSVQAKLDNICFPPMPTAIASAGNDRIVCNEAPIDLGEAYAYYCDSVRWTTEGDGRFEDDAVVNTMYIPGNQDISNGQVTLTLTAYGNETFTHSVVIQFANETSLGSMVGDSIVNKYESHVSHYSVDRQEGIHYIWQLAPAEAGTIFDQGNEIDILWNLTDGDAEVTLSVTADNGCTTGPVTKTISLIGYDVPEWSTADFDLFPNPTDGKVNLVIGETLQGKATVEVYNLLGERMMAKSLGHLQQNETITLDLSRLASGLYIIKLSTANGSCTKKVSVR